MFVGPDIDCPLCPRLVAYRHANRASFPDWHNGPVPSFVGKKPVLLVVGLAPGLRGANCTGRPFTGDWAGDLLYATMLKFGFAKGSYQERADDGLKLIGAAITNAVRCVPPENKPTPAEAKTCRKFFDAEVQTYKDLKVLLALGRIAHEAILRSFSLKLPAYPFTHGALHKLPNGLLLADSYHCSRYNTNTGRLTTEMFENVFRGIRKAVDA